MNFHLVKPDFWLIFICSIYGHLHYHFRMEEVHCLPLMHSFHFYLVLPPFGNDTANAHRLSKWKPIKNLILPNENSWNLTSKSILSFFHMTLVCHHKIQLKKSKPVKIGQNGSISGAAVYVDEFLPRTLRRKFVLIWVLCHWVSWFDDSKLSKVNFSLIVTSQ